MMFGFFINLSGLFSVLSAPFGAGASAAGAMAQERATRRALEAQRRAAMPRVVDGQSHIPRVEKRK